MREMRIHVWCDACFAEGEQRVEIDPSDSVTISLGTAPRTLDLCERHHKAFVAPLAELLSEHGAKLGTTPKPPAKLSVVPRPQSSSPVPSSKSEAMSAPWQCPLCSADMMRSSAVSHVWGRHRKGEAPPEQPTQCPDCSFDSQRSQSMATHRSKQHEWSPLDDALAGVK